MCSIISSLVGYVQAKIHSGMKQKNDYLYFSLRFSANKNTSFLPNIQNQHLYSVSFFAEIVSEIVSPCSAQVNLQAPSTDK